MTVSSEDEESYVLYLNLHKSGFAADIADGNEEPDL